MGNREGGREESDRSMGGYLNKPLKVIGCDRNQITD